MKSGRLLRYYFKDFSDFSECILNMYFIHFISTVSLQGILSIMKNTAIWLVLAVKIKATK